MRACALCHYPNGKGKPDNAAVSGLPEAYFIQQLLDYRNGTRKSTNPNKRNAIMMADMARVLNDLRSGARQGAWSDLMEAAVAKLTDDDILELSAYAASLAP